MNQEELVANLGTIARSGSKVTVLHFFVISLLLAVLTFPLPLFLVLFMQNVVL